MYRNIDVDFGFNVRGGTNADFGAATIKDTGDYQKRESGGSGTGGTPGAAATPSTGDLSVRAYNAHASAQDILIKYWIRERV